MIVNENNDVEVDLVGSVICSINLLKKRASVETLYCFCLGCLKLYSAFEIKYYAKHLAIPSRNLSKHFN